MCDRTCDRGVTSLHLALPNEKQVNPGMKKVQPKTCVLDFTGSLNPCWIGKHEWNLTWVRPGSNPRLNPVQIAQRWWQTKIGEEEWKLYEKKHKAVCCVQREPTRNHWHTYTRTKTLFLTTQRSTSVNVTRGLWTTRDHLDL